jgi:hypothetical protein
VQRRACRQDQGRQDESCRHQFPPQP